MVREFPDSELIDRRDLKNQLREIIKNDLFNNPFTLQDVVEGLGAESSNPTERGKSNLYVGDDPEINIKKALDSMTKEGYLEYNEEDKTYEVSEDTRTRMSA